MSRDSIRAAYERESVTGYYRRHGGQYCNPHEPVVAELMALASAAWELRPYRTLDLACGSGEATRALERLGFVEIEGVDPFTAESYRERTGRRAEEFSFQEIAAGALSGRRYELIVCSFGLHLAAPSRLPLLLWRLRELAPRLLILTPHKRPKIDPRTGWELAGELLHRRVRARWYERRSLQA